MNWILRLLISSFYMAFLVLSHQSNKHRGSGVKTGIDYDDFARFASDVDHITEHLRDTIDLNKEMTPEVLEFYYFMEHDLNNDTKLDGLEILSAIKHSDLADELKVDTKNLTPEEAKKAYEQEIDHYTDIIDEIMREDDFNNDGYLSYLEYVMARRRDAKQAQKTKKKN